MTENTMAKKKTDKKTKNEMPVPSQGHYGFHSFPVVDCDILTYFQQENNHHGCH
jgi:hypothetical protein